VNTSDEPLPTMVEVAFAVAGPALPREHRRLLADALERALPWLSQVPGAGIHRLNVAAGGGALALLSKRTRLTLRLPRERVAEAAALAGTELPVGAGCLRVGPAQERELRPYGTLYAHFVAADDGDEAAFLRHAQDTLSALGVACRAICGRHQVLEAGTLQGFSLMLDGLSRAGAVRVLEVGVGRHRRLGCGLFVAHKSAAAVGSAS
jgi:CRISPR-associated protein Cas6